MKTICYIRPFAHKPPLTDLHQFGTGVAVVDVIILAKIFGYRLRDVDSVGVENGGFHWLSHWLLTLLTRLRREWFITPEISLRENSSLIAIKYMHINLRLSDFGIFFRLAVTVHRHLNGHARFTTVPVGLLCPVRRGADTRRYPRSANRQQGASVI